MPVSADEAYIVEREGGTIRYLAAPLCIAVDSDLEVSLWKISFWILNRGVLRS